MSQTAPMTPRPLFLIGLPKSGTTLVQRLLATHPDIATTDEPWILLPMVYARRARGTVAEYGARSARISFEALVEALPNGASDYHAALRAMAETIYRRLSPPGAAYFLDKTPRYHLIAEELIDIFPDAVFVFVLRNPLSVIASIIEHNGGRIAGLAYGTIDIRKGYPNIAMALERVGERAVVLDYDQLVDDPETEIACVFESLRLPGADVTQGQFTRTTFKRGDRNGAAYATISGASRNKWRKTLATPMRKTLTMRLIQELDANALSIHGFEKAQLLSDLASLQVSYSVQSVVEYMEFGIAMLHKKLQRALLRQGCDGEFMY